MPSARPRGIGRRRILAAAAVAVAALVAVLGFDSLSILWLADYRTGAGETKVVTLADGTRVHLDARTAVAVDFSARHRGVRLLDGEAWFEVARDSSRLFTVSAGGETITALGTAFDVATERARTEDTVTAHRVAVAANGVRKTLDKGQQASFGPSLALGPPRKVEAATAWRRGKLMFQDQPFGEVVAHLARYHHGYVFVTDAATRARRVSGVFRTNDPPAALRALVRSLGLRATWLTDYLVLIRG